MDSSVRAAVRQTFQPNASLAGENPSSWVIGLTQQGECLMQEEGAPEPILVRRHDVTLVRPGIKHSWRVPNGASVARPGAASPWTILYVIFSPRVHVLEWLLQLTEDRGLQRIHLSTAPIRQHVEAALLNALGHRAGANADRQEMTLHCVESAILWCRRMRRESQTPVLPRVRAALNFLHDNLGSPSLRIETVTQACHTSRSRLLHDFRTQVGMPLMTYLERERMRRAQELLSAGYMSVKEVAGEVGYRDPKHFSRRFRALTGRSPSALRQPGQPRATQLQRGSRYAI